MVGETWAKFVIVVVVLVWAITTVVLPIAVKGYTPPPEVGTIMGAVAGGACAMVFVKRAAGKNDDDDEKKE